VAGRSQILVLRYSMPVLRWPPLNLVCSVHLVPRNARQNVVRRCRMLFGSAKAWWHAAAASSCKVLVDRPVTVTHRRMGQIPAIAGCM
jgi:hypothetical protein